MSVPQAPDSRPRRRPIDRLRRGVRTALVTGAVRLLAAAFSLIPWRLAQAIGRGIGRAGWRVSSAFRLRDHRRTLDHLELAFPDLPEAERRRIARACYHHLGTVLGEMLWLLSRDCRRLARHLRTEGLDRVAEIRASGRPVVFFTGHCGNWELLAAAVNCSGLSMAVVARALDEAGLQDLLTRARGRFGTRVIDRGAPSAARELLRALRDGAVGMLIDQDTKVDGDWVPFFGRPAYTPIGAARLALHRDAAVIPCFVQRLPDGSHVARFQDPLDLPDDPVEATAAMTRMIEEQIRRVPEQWVWMHRRWRRQPPLPETDTGR